MYLNTFDGIAKGVKPQMNTLYSSTRHAKFNLSYHIIWCPKYRKGILSDKQVIQTVTNSITEMAEEHGCTINALEIMPDHIHLSVSAPPRFSPANLAAKFKGASGSRVAAKFPELKSRGRIWSRSYFCTTTGSVSTDAIKHYIKTQWSRIK